METIVCKSKEEFRQAALNSPGILEIHGDVGYINALSKDVLVVAEGSVGIGVNCGDSPVIICKGTSTPVITCNPKSSPTIISLDHSAPLIYAEKLSQVDILAHNKSAPFIDSSGGVTNLQARGESKVAFRGVVRIQGSDPTAEVRVVGPGFYEEVEGSTRIKQLINDVHTWVDLFGLPIIDNGYVYLYKSLRDNFASNWNKHFFYTPGTTPEAPDWDPTIECGHGLHFSPTPQMAKYFYPDGKKYTACKVKLSEIVLHYGGQFPEKVKAPRVYEVFEVDILGNRI